MSKQSRRDRHNKRPKATSRAKLPAAGPAPRQLQVGRELADTTWRISVPVVLFASAGIVADRFLDSGPWLTLSGMLLGLVAAGYLVILQLRRWPAEPVKPGSYERNHRPGDDDNNDYYND